MRAVLIDTGVMVALLDRDEAQHQRCVKAIEEVRAPLITCEAVIAECCHLLRSIPGAQDAILENVQREIFRIPKPQAAAAPAVRQLMKKYRDAGIDLADACLVDLANEFDTGAILTLDRDFRVYRWGKRKPFEFLISPR